MRGVEVTELNEWLGSQLEAWDVWAKTSTNSWFALPTGNERFPDLGQMFRHAFTPLHRYSDQALASDPADDSDIPTDAWPPLYDWAEKCLARHREACDRLEADRANEVLEYRTRSAGNFNVTRRHALTHAATHCFWHLGGIAHLLRSQRIPPPQHSDFLFFAAKLNAE
jgi:uncharacterized damage-inducible protein DinB